MAKISLILLGTILGFMQGVVFFVIVHVSPDSPREMITSGEILDYPALLYGGVGAVCGAVLCWALYAGAKKNRVYVSVPRKSIHAGEKPYHGPFG